MKEYKPRLNILILTYSLVFILTIIVSFVFPLLLILFVINIFLFMIFYGPMRGKIYVLTDKAILIKRKFGYIDSVITIPFKNIKEYSIQKSSWKISGASAVVIKTSAYKGNYTLSYITKEDANEIYNKLKRVVKI